MSDNDRRHIGFTLPLVLFAAWAAYMTWWLAVQAWGCWSSPFLDWLGAFFVPRWLGWYALFSAFFCAYAAWLWAGAAAAKLLSMAMLRASGMRAVRSDWQPDGSIIWCGFLVQFIAGAGGTAVTAIWTAVAAFSVVFTDEPLVAVIGGLAAYVVAALSVTVALGMGGLSTAAGALSWFAAIWIRGMAEGIAEPVRGPREEDPWER